MARQRPRRPRSSSASSDDGTNPPSGAADQSADSALNSVAASRDENQSLGNQPVSLGSNSSVPPSDSALEALADRADEMSEPEDDEVAEAYASGAGQQVVEADASGAGSKAEVPTSGLESNQHQDQSPSSSDCILVNVTRPSDGVSGSKTSTPPILTTLDVALMREKEEMILQKRLDIARRCEKLQAEITSDLQQFLSQNPASNASPSSEEFVKFGMLKFRESGDLSLPSTNQSSSSKEKKTSGASGAAVQENGNSVFPPNGVVGFTDNAAPAQGQQSDKGANAPNHAPQNYIALVEAASRMLWEVRAGGTIEVLPPLEERCELVKDMLAELKQTANAAFADCGELTEGKALLALEASRYLHEATGWPSVAGAMLCLQRKVHGSQDEGAVPTPTFRVITPPVLPVQASNKAKTSLVVGGGGTAGAGGKKPTGKKDEAPVPEPKKQPPPVPPIPRVKPGKAPTSHDERVGELLRAGWRYDDILHALDASKDEGGNEDLEQAQAHLESLRQWRLRNANMQASRTFEERDEGPDRIPEGSELALYIAVNPDHIDACLLMLEVHEQNSRSHHADHFRIAANLMAKVQGEAATSKLATFALRKIALAVVNDCSKCAALREKELAAKKEKEKELEERAAKKARELELKAEQEAAKAKKEAEEKAKTEERASRRPRTPPLPADDSFFMEDPFDPKDSAWLSKRRGGLCYECGEEDLGIVDGVDMTYVQLCEVCNRKIHRSCSR
jgi:AhpD family alkylhydroperoxidase